MSRPLLGTSSSEIGIDRDDREPIQSQIARQLRSLVLSGRLKPQTKLPSTRALSEELNVARATVVEAYEQLVSEGYLETRSGSGTRVAAELPETLLTSSPKERAREPSRATGRREPARPFRSGLVDWENFPHDDWGRLLGRFWRNPPVTLLEHNDPFGWLPLREAIARHLYEWRGIDCAAEQVIVTAGGLDAFDLIGRSILKPGDEVWFEEPGYPTARRIFSLGGVTAIPVPVDAEGMVVTRGCDRAPGARAAFVTPARQYPTGVTMPLARRLELLDWAADADAIVIEDDYDSEYRYVGKPLPALMSLDKRARVIYTGTFSKVFSPIVRLGYIVVPLALVKRFREERLSHGAPPSLMAQPALAEFMGSGAFAIHIRRMRRIYAARRRALIEALKQAEGKLFTVDASPAGLMLLLRLPAGVSDEAMVEKLAAKGIEAQSLSSHYAGRKREQGLLLSFAGFSEDDLQQAAAKLIGVLT
ncbi:PLP-dependent aminotransferase family protein [Aestuariivirga litoralis]|uniref:PLP-dependent aminotransferase family protein n=1 Tax=Aestuariivirga litoralis TaxID=2650924 RepID=A0A2W2AZ06_9HYPH|nr:PLP-dependent aminotransferase family protein [Aestuariivirga litoralis]PZF77850.1 PLP-dependent aminotransferase family protein [Aestuariivirga litoralis]